jgi:hypothetical protein
MAVVLEEAAEVEAVAVLAERFPTEVAVADATNLPQNPQQQLQYLQPLETLELLQLVR